MPVIPTVRVGVPLNCVSIITSTLWITAPDGVLNKVNGDAVPKAREVVSTLMHCEVVPTAANSSSNTPAAVPAFCLKTCPSVPFAGGAVRVNAAVCAAFLASVNVQSLPDPAAS